jgi:predicted acyl esterase
VAHIHVREITYAWFDHVLRGAPRPALLRDRVNYQVMGANTWRHAPSLEAMRSQTLRLFLTDTVAAAPVGSLPGVRHALSSRRPARPGVLTLTVDLADRKATHNDYYPFPIVGKTPELGKGFSFLSEPFSEPVSVDGTLTGRLNVTINKKDVDVGVVLYEVMPDGRLFHLSYFLGRASHARDMTRRQLLTPGRKQAIVFERTRMVSRQLSAGSRLLVTLNVNVNPHAQVNHGTGKDVSDESIADAGTPLRVQWHNDSHVNVPLRRP